MRVVYYGRELYHAATGAQRPNHKYIDRIKVGDAWRYFYDKASLAAYNAGKSIKGVAKDVIDNANKVKTDIKNASGLIKDTTKLMKDVADGKASYTDAEKAVSRIFDAATNTPDPIYNKVAKGLLNWYNDHSKKIDAEYAKNVSKTNAEYAKNVNNMRKMSSERSAKMNADYKAAAEKMHKDFEDKYKKVQSKNQVISRRSQLGLKSTKLNNSGNAPKNNQGIARIKDSGNAPKYNQGIPEQPVIDKVREELKNASPEQLEFLEEIVRKQHRGEW